jgi:phage shock protein PspC (stress-responsive transcriptional regulator)
MSDTSNNLEATIATSARPHFQRRRAGSILTGVCSGIAAALNVEANLIRVGCVIGALLSPWIGLTYIALAFALPSDQNAVNGRRPFFDGEILISQIKRSARAVTHAAAKKNQRTFGRAWHQQLPKVCRAWHEALGRQARRG